MLHWDQCLRRHLLLHPLELEIGAPDVAQFLRAKEGHSLIHYGTSASHEAARALIFGTPVPDREIMAKSGI